MIVGGGSLYLEHW